MEIDFPIEFLVQGTPVSSQAKRPASKTGWKRRVRSASSKVIPNTHFASNDRIAVTLFYFPDLAMQGDIDNIVKPILDALSQHIYMDDNQIERLVVQKFEPGNIFSFSRPSATFGRALGAIKPVLYVRISNDPFEELA